MYTANPSCPGSVHPQILIQEVCAPSNPCLGSVCPKSFLSGKCAHPQILLVREVCTLQSFLYRKCVPSNPSCPGSVCTPNSFLSGKHAPQIILVQEVCTPKSLYGMCTPKSLSGKRVHPQILSRKCAPQILVQKVCIPLNPSLIESSQFWINRVHIFLE